MSSFKVLVIVAVSVSCVMGDCGVVTRQEWEAVKPVHVRYLARPVGLVIIQHTVTPACSTDAACAETVRNIQTWLMENQHYPDISYSKDKYLARPVGLVIVQQHTVTPACSTDGACAETVRNIQSWLMESQHYPDISYSFLIGGNGKVYEGTGWLHVGAHTYGYNSKSIAIAFIGNFNNDEPTAQMLDAAQALIKCGVERGHLKPDYHLIGARQLIATESPGRKLYNEIRSWPNYLEDVSSIQNLKS